MILEDLNRKVRRRLDDDPLAADFQVGLLSAALASYRYDTVLRPVPPMFDRGADDKDYKGLENALSTFGDLGGIQGISKQLNHETNSVSDKAWQLLDWVINNNNVTVQSIEKSKFSMIKELTKQTYHDTPAPNYIFEVTYSQPLNEKFEEVRGSRDTMFGYHGSRVENFHSILHYGLHSHMNKNALFGEGTYLSSELSVSMSYSPSGQAWASSEIGDRLSCVAVCEIIDHPSVKSRTHKDKNGSTQTRARAADSMGGDVPDKYYVVQNNEVIRLKYILVYADKSKTKRWNETSWIVRHKFAIMMAVYALILLIVGIINSRPFQSMMRKWK